MHKGKSNNELSADDRTLLTVCACVYVHVYIYARVSIYARVYVCRYARVYVGMYEHVCVCVCVEGGCQMYRLGFLFWCQCVSQSISLRPTCRRLHCTVRFHRSLRALMSSIIICYWQNFFTGKKLPGPVKIIPLHMCVPRCWGGSIHANNNIFPVRAGIGDCRCL